MKRRHVILGMGLIGAGLLAMFGDRAPRTEVAEAVDRPLASVRPASLVRQRDDAPSKAPETTGPQILALVSRNILIGDGDEAFNQDRNPVFAHQDWTPPPPPPPPAPPPPPPTAPPLPFTFIGKAATDGAWEVYLARGERTYVVHDKEVIEGTYRVDAIAPPVLTLTYLPLRQVQQLNIGVF